MIKKILIWLGLAETEEEKRRRIVLEEMELEVEQLRQQCREGWIRIAAHMAIEKARYDSVLKRGVK